MKPPGQLGSNSPVLPVDAPAPSTSIPALIRVVSPLSSEVLPAASATAIPALIGPIIGAPALGGSAPTPLLLPANYKMIYDDLGPIGGGVTAPKRVRTEDDLLYAAKYEMPGPSQHTVRASEYIWLSIARLVHLPATAPEILQDASNNLYCATRLHPNVVAGANRMQLLSGSLYGAGLQLIRIYAFDLFAGNGDRHPNNYLVLDEGGVMVLHAIDFSHVAAHPGLPQAFGDPISTPGCATRTYFPLVSSPYGCQPAPGIEIINRLRALNRTQIEGVVNNLPPAWLNSPVAQAVIDWWVSPARTDRADNITQGLGNGTYL